MKRLRSRPVVFWFEQRVGSLGALTASRLYGYTASMATGNEMAKTSIRLPRKLWRDVRRYALDHDMDAQDIVAEALTAWLKSKQGAKRNE